MRASPSIHLGLCTFVIAIAMLFTVPTHAAEVCSKFGTERESEIPKKALPECRLEYRLLEVRGELPICAAGKKYMYQLNAIFCRVLRRNDNERYSSVRD